MLLLLSSVLGGSSCVFLRGLLSCFSVLLCGGLLCLCLALSSLFLWGLYIVNGFLGSYFLGGLLDFLVGSIYLFLGISGFLCGGNGCFVTVGSEVVFQANFNIGAIIAF